MQVTNQFSQILWKVRPCQRLRSVVGCNQLCLWVKRWAAAYEATRPPDVLVCFVCGVRLWKIHELETTLASFDPQAHGELFEQRL